MAAPKPASAPLTEGTLGTRHFSSVLYQLHHQGFGGTLNLQNESVYKQIFFEAGLVKFAISNREEERFGQILCRTGRITMGQMEYALEASKKLEGGPGKLGRALVEMGFMKPPDVLAALRDQIKEIVVDVFVWEEGTFQASPENPRQGEAVKLSVDMGALVREGIARIANPVFLLRLIGTMDTEIRLTSSAMTAMKNFRPSPKEQQIIQLASRGIRLRDLCNMLPYPAVETSQLVLNLLTFGVLERGEGLG